MSSSSVPDAPILQIIWVAFLSYVVAAISFIAFALSPIGQWIGNTIDDIEGRIQNG